MNLIQFLEEKIEENKILKTFSLNISNSSASINDKIFKSSVSKKEFKQILMDELLGKTEENIGKLNEALIELKFQLNDSSYEIHFTTKVEGDSISTVLIKLNKNEDSFKDELKSSVKESGNLFKTKMIENLVELIFFIVNMYKEETPEEAEKETKEVEENPKPPKTEEPKEENEIEEPKEQENVEEVKWNNIQFKTIIK